ncbi:DUF2061 domain-containing protein [Sphingomonas aliaeris]|uniref:DUF2061 domain-containing protein n=1 Tax=Sphingomonas aliaeris TaxID=2759526 RepID=A0A974NU80_9SPHN|nr:DUF2061 domain-containing protein [Sphingomonas aliaeris]QQV77039.1 DUF2061 domain-containing protein [Sphingomonas aliaeris]
MFLFRGVESHPRSLVKAVSWRTVGSIDTFVLGLLFTGGNAKIAGSIAGTEVITKILLFYFHERAWSMVKWGHRPFPVEPDQSGEGAATPV